MKKMSFYEEIENLGHEDNNNFNIFINNSPKSEAEQINYLSVTPRQPTPSGWESAQNIFNSQPTDIKFST